MEMYFTWSSVQSNVPGAFGVLFHGTGRAAVGREHLDALLLGRLEVGLQRHHVPVLLAARAALAQVQSSFHRLNNS